MAEQKKQEATNGEFKTAPLGFDKNEVMAYIVQINKSKKALQEEVDDLKRALEAKEAEVPDTSALEEIEKKKAELDAQILDSRKQILDERRKLAQTEKELHVLQDQYKALAEEYTEFKQKAKKKLEKAKKSGGGGTISEAQLEEISAKANADANEVLADANKKAQDIIDAAKAYYEETVKKAQEYKQTVLAKGSEYSEGVTSGSGAISATVDVFELLSAVAQEINDAVNSAIDSASEKAKAETESTGTADEKKLSEDETVVAARTALEASAEAALGEYEPMTVAPYDFKLTIEMPEGAEAVEEDEDDEDEDFITPDENGLLSSFAVISSADTSDDDMSAGTDNSFGEEDVVITAPSATGFDDISDLMMDAAPTPAKKEEPAPAPAVKADDDISDLFTSAPAPAPAPAKKEEPAPAPAVKADDDISDLFTSAPAPAPAPAKKEEPAPVPEVKADDDISDLFTSAPAPAPEAPKYKRAHSREGYGSNGEKLNESVAMGVAGKEAKPNDPWKDLEAQMNGMTFTAPSAPASDLDDGMTSSYDDAPVEQETKADDKIDMSDYSSMLGGLNDNMNTSAAQFDPNWEFQMMEGSGDDEDDEMSSDNVGFFDL